MPEIVERLSSGARGISGAIAAASSLRRRNSPGMGHGPPKRGMWVARLSDPGQVGILVDLVVGDVALVMAVDELGLNLFQYSAPASEFRQAYFEEIPGPRRPDESLALRFGYVRGPA